MLVPSSQGSGSVAAASHAGIITNLLVGAPAHRSKQFRKGDRVVKVDETAIDDHGHDLTKLLVGSDVPGSLVTVHVTRGGQPMPAITLTRACTREHADQRRMFQLFMRLKELAHEEPGADNTAPQQIESVVDQTIDLWGKMLEAHMVHDEKIVSNVHDLQTKAETSLIGLRERLRELRFLSLSALSGADGLARKQADFCTIMRETVANAEAAAETLNTEKVSLAMDLTNAKGAMAELRAELAALRAASEAQIDKLGAEKAMLKERLDNTAGELQAVRAAFKEQCLQLDKSIETQEEEMAELRAELAALRAASKAEIDKLGAEKAMLKAEIDKLGAEKVMLKAEIGKLGAEKAMLKERLDNTAGELEAVRAALRSSLLDKKYRDAHLKDEIRTLQGQLSSIEEAANALMSELQMQVEMAHEDIAAHKVAACVLRRRCSAMLCLVLYRDRGVSSDTISVATW